MPKKKEADLVPKTKTASPRKSAAKPKKEQQDPLVPVVLRDDGAAPRGGESVGHVPPIVNVGGVFSERRALLRRLFACLALVLVMVLAVFIYIYRPTEYTERKHSVTFWHRAETDTTVIAVNGTALRGEYEGACTAYAYDGDGSSCAAVIGDALYLVRGTRVSEVERGVTDFLLSQNGKALVYRNAGGELVYCTVGFGLEKSLITRDALASGYALSPDGKELFYTYAEGGVNRVAIYSRTNSAPVLSRTEGGLPVAIADRCRHAYFKDETTNTLYYMNGDGDVRKLLFGEQVAGAYTLTFNRDFTELLIDVHGGTTLLWKSGERVMLPTLGTLEQARFLPNQRAAQSTLFSAKQHLVKSFLGAYYVRTSALGSSTMLSYLNEKGEFSDIFSVSETQSGVTVTDKAVYFLSIPIGDGQRYLYRCKQGATKAEMMFAVDVTSFVVNAKGNRVFYTDQHNALYTAKVGNAAIRLQGADKIADGSLCITADGVVYFNDENGTLLKSNNGAKPRALGMSAAARTDAYTAYFIVQNENGSAEVRASHRNLGVFGKIADGVSP